MRCWASGDIPGFYLNAGTALELAIKARLCKYGVAMLGPGRPDWFKQVMRLVRDADVIGDGSPFSVSGSEALERLIELEPRLGPDLGSPVRDTIGRCNMVKHVGTTARLDDDERIEQAGAFVAAVDLLVQIPPGDFWSEHLALAESLVQEARTVVAVRVATAATRARERLEAIFDRLDEFVAKATADIGDDEDGDHGVFTQVECPICGSPSRAYGELVDNGDVEADWNPDGTNYFWAPVPTTIVDGFRCDVCEFALNGVDEIAASDVPPLVVNDRVDPDLLVEPDFDSD
jgi:hypothetical protein